MQQITFSLNLPGGSTLGYIASVSCCKISLSAQVTYGYTEVGKCPS
jgi:hypothetical protein